MEKYNNWAKIALTKEQTKILYDAIVELMPEMKPLLLTFDNGYFLVEGEDVYISKQGRLKPFSVTCNTRKKLNLSVIKVYGELYFRIFITTRRQSYYDYKPILETYPFTIQLSSKEQILNQNVKIPNISNKEEYMQKHGIVVFKDQAMKKTCLTKNHLMMQYWPTLLKDDNIQAVITNLKDYSSFSSICHIDSKIVMYNYRKIFNEIRYKFNEYKFAIDDDRYLLCRVAHSTYVVFENIMHFLDGIR